MPAGTNDNGVAVLVDDTSCILLRVILVASIHAHVYVGKLHLGYEAKYNSDSHHKVRKKNNAIIQSVFNRYTCSYIECVDNF